MFVVHFWQFKTDPFDVFFERVLKYGGMTSSWFVNDLED